MNTLTKVQGTSEASQVEKRYVAPEVDIEENKDEYVLRADMPGVNKSGLEVLLENNELTLIGHRQPVKSDEGTLYRESNSCDYRRTFMLDPMIEAARISAQIEQGVLTVRLPKAEQVKPRKVKVTD